MKGCRRGAEGTRGGRGNACGGAGGEWGRGRGGGAVEGCELARSNPYHRCSARCEELAAERRALYGGEGRPATAGAGGDAAPTLLPGAVPVPSLADGEGWRRRAGPAGDQLRNGGEVGLGSAWGILPK